MNSPLVSVIVPVHNRSEYVEQCFESISLQTYQNIELIIVDDASSEDIPSVIAKIDWPFVNPPRYIRLAENSGPGIARETGRQVATGAYISYLDSDDLWHKEFVASLLKTLLDNPIKEMSYCDPISFTTTPFTGNEARKRHRPVEAILPYPLFRRPWVTSSIMWTRQAADRIGPWSSYRFGEDTLQEIRAGCADISVAYVPNALCYIRQHQNVERLSTPSIETFHTRVQFTADILACIVEHGKNADRFVADTLALFLFRSLSGTILINRKSVGQAYITFIIKQPNTHSVLKLLAFLHLFFLSIPSKRLSRELCRIVSKHVVTRFYLRRWNACYTGWDKFGL